MLIKTEYYLNERDRSLMELEGHGKTEEIRIDNEILKQAINLHLVLIKDGFLLKNWVVNNGSSLRISTGIRASWLYKDKGGITRLLLKTIPKLEKQNEARDLKERLRKLREQNDKILEEMKYKASIKEMLFLGYTTEGLKAKIDRIEAEIKENKDKISKEKGTK